jgi:hypothetical protein
MYSTCIFCHSSLGSNDVIEHFPVGRRLAFDASRGRLWVVCGKCERWNLTPLEERWEAIEECERAFTETRLRVSTDNIGMARLKEGLELVRIGAPLRPEMASWRYGDQFGRRRKRHLLYSGIGLAGAASFVILGPVTGVIAGSSWGMWNIVSFVNTAYQQRRVRASLLLPEYAAPITIRLKQLNRISIVSRGEDWALRVPFQPTSTQPVLLSNGRMLQGSKWNSGAELSTILTGEAALQAASKLLPAINAQGAKRNEVESAVSMIAEVAANPSSLFARHASHGPGQVRRGAPPPDDGWPAIIRLPKEVRLALEMVTHEDAERRALEGELSLLETEWRQAEEIAAIADDMFLPESARARLSELKGAVTRSGKQQP